MKIMNYEFKFLEQNRLTELAKKVLYFYVPIALEIPSLRTNPNLINYEIKSSNKSGILDVVTEADKYVQAKIKKQLPDNWQFWGEEGSDNISEYDETKDYLLITDPIEGTNNFIEKLDDQWGSVISVIDIKSRTPIIGIVAHPANGIIYLGVKDNGAYKLVVDKNNLQGIKLTSKPESEYDFFTYNNSPHFSEELSAKINTLFAKGKVRETKTSNKLIASRKTVVINNQRFEDPESGALEVVRNKGTIYFKTSNEMSACFVILKEIGGYITDGNGKDWTLGIKTLISARNKSDYDFLKQLYDSLNAD